MKSKYSIPFLLIILICFLFFIYKRQKETVLTKHDIPEETSIIILSPHFDDAVLSLGGFLTQSKSKAVVITLFTKENEKIQKTYWDEISGFNDSSESIKYRTQENKEALDLLGNKIKNYKFNNFQYDENREEKKLLNSLIEELENITSDTKGETFIYSPMIFDKKNIHVHPDHYILHVAITEIIKKNTNPNIKFFMYEDYPYIEKSNFSINDSIKFVNKNSNVKLEAEYIQLSELDFKNKIKSMKKYKSQITAFESLGEDLLSGLYKFNRSRCNLLELYACEIVYKVN